MTELLGFIVVIVIVVGFHELGHYLAARSCGVHVLAFAIGFGKPLASRVDRHGTEWRFCPFLLGGYVQMLMDAKEAEKLDLPPERSLEGRPRWQRAWVVFAGPLANFLLAVAMFYGVALIGESGLRARIGAVEADSPAALAGFSAGDDIVAVDGHEVLLWSSVYEELFTAVGDHDSQIGVESGGVARTLVLPTGDMPPSVLGDGSLFNHLGMRPDTSYITMELEEVVAGSPAAVAGLQPGDIVIAAAGAIMYSWAEFVGVIRAAPGQGIEVVVARGGDDVTVAVVPEAVGEPGSAYGRLGVIPVFDEDKHAQLLVTESEGALSAAPAAVRRAWRALATTLRFLGYLVNREVSTEHLSGPVGIAKISGTALTLGLQVFLVLVAQISISLGLFNLLPIPVLDGGHLLRYAIEGAFNRELPPKVIQTASIIGVALIIALMIFAIYNDLT